MPVPRVGVDLDDEVGDHVLRARRAVGVLARAALVHAGDRLGAAVSCVGAVGGDHRVGEERADALVVAGVDQLRVAVHEVGDRGVVGLVVAHACLPTEEEHVGEQGAGAAVAAQRDLGAVDLTARARAAQLLDAAGDPLEHLHDVAAVAERHGARRRW